jgi:hypothetical protein
MGSVYSLFFVLLQDISKFKILVVLFLFKEQRDTAGMWLHPITQKYTKFKNRFSLGEAQWALWENSQSSPNQTWPEHIRTLGSVSYNHVSGDVVLVCTPGLNTQPK